MRKRTFFLFACMLLLTSAAHANHYSDTYVIPVVGHVQGAGGTMWMTDLIIRNFQTTPLDVQLIVIESGLDTANNVHPLQTSTINGTVTVPPNATVLLEDIMDGHRGMAGSIGSLIIGADKPFAVTSRTYNNSSPLGQTVPPTANFLVNSFGDADNAAVAYVPGIVNNAQLRTNIGLTAGSGSAAGMRIEITIRNAAGGIVGTRIVSVPAGTFMHVQFPVAELLAPGSTLALGSADFRIIEGEGAVVPYASIIDNATSIATYIMGQFPEPTLTSTLTNSSWMSGPSVFRMLIERGAYR